MRADKAKVLVVEDEASIRKFISINLHRADFEVLEAEDGETALRMAESCYPDVIVLDVMLPAMDGFEVCMQIRRLMPQVIIIMLTARGEDMDKIMGLELGADDYMVKPFNPLELVARIRANLRKLASYPSAKARCVFFRELKLDLEGQRFFRNGTEIELTPTEFAIMKVFMNSPGKAFSRNEIMNSVWGQNYSVEPALALDPARWEGEEGSIHRRINYISNDYVCVKENLKQSSLNDGNTGEGSKLQIFAVDSLPAMKAVKISDLAGAEAVAAMEQGYRKLAQQLGAKQIAPHLRDEENYGLARKMGYWIFKGRANDVEYNITVIPPDHVVFYNNLNIPWTRVKNHVPSAVDVFTSPDKDMALVVTGSEIIVYRMYQENLAGHPLERIPLKEGEEVIMAEWALGHYVENWTLTFQTYLAKESTD